MTEPAKPTLPEVLPLVRALYATRHGVAGGCLHIVLDDCNVYDDIVEDCIQWAEDHECAECEALGRLLLRMSKTQRRKLAKAHRETPGHKG